MGTLQLLGLGYHHQPQSLDYSNFYFTTSFIDLGNKIHTHTHHTYVMEAASFKEKNNRDSWDQNQTQLTYMGTFTVGRKYSSMVRSTDSRPRCSSSKLTLVFISYMSLSIFYSLSNLSFFICKRRMEMWICTF